MTLTKELAQAGGKPVRKNPFAPWPSFENDEIEAATSTLRSGRINYWTGDEGRFFEKEFASYVGTRHAVALTNGTVALELALVALGIGSGDDVVVPSRSFLATASCAVMRGARPVFADVDRDSQNVTAATIEAALTPATKAIIPVHLAGWPCDMDPIMELSRRRGISVIEDGAQAHGAVYKGRAVGSIGDIGAFSFCQDKIMTTAGEGGMITLNDERRWKDAWGFKDHGKSYDTVYNQQHEPGFRWLHESFGTNWRLTEMQSALGRVLLRKLDERVARRRQNAAALIEGLSKIPSLRVPVPPKDVRHSYYKFYVFLDVACLREGWTRQRVMDAITAEGIPCFVGSCSEMYLEKAFPEELRPSKRLPIARELGETSLMFLVHHTLTTEDMRDTVHAVEKVLETATH